MDRFDRIFKLNRILQQSRLPVSRKTLEQELECSRATVKRIIEDMRLYLNAPIEYDRTLNGYYYDNQQGNMYELPGLWFSADELQALLSMDQLLSEVKPGLLNEHIKPLRKRVGDLLKLSPNKHQLQSTHIKLIRTAYREPSTYFPHIALATSSRLAIKINYKNYYKNETTERVISPQQMTYYRDNWYIDAWCHQRKALRRFAVDAIVTSIDSTEEFQPIASTELQQHFAEHYGIFTSNDTPSTMATLLFSPKAASWVAREHWHHQQQGKILENGHYQLKLPYSNPAELIGDILKFGPEVEIVSPDSLKQALIQQLSKTLNQYNSE